MGRVKVYNSDNGVYMAKHPDYPLFEIDGTTCEVKTTEKTKQKHIREVLEDQELLNEVVDETGIETSELLQRRRTGHSI